MHWIRTTNRAIVAWHYICLLHLLCRRCLLISTGCGCGGVGCGSLCCSNLRSGIDASSINIHIEIDSQLRVVDIDTHRYISLLRLGICISYCSCCLGVSYRAAGAACVV